jgi:hypothetical protein
MSGSKGRIILHGDPTKNPEWEGVIDDIQVESLPIRHITELTLNLKGNKKTVVEVPTILAQAGNDTTAAQRVNNIIKEHSHIITSIDFKVNMSQLQSQVDQARQAFTKKINKTIKRKHAEEKRNKGKK